MSDHTLIEAANGELRRVNLDAGQTTLQDALGLCDDCLVPLVRTEKGGLRCPSCGLEF